MGPALAAGCRVGVRRQVEWVVSVSRMPGFPQRRGSCQHTWWRSEGQGLPGADRRVASEPGCPVVYPAVSVGLVGLDPLLPTVSCLPQTRREWATLSEEGGCLRRAIDVVWKTGQAFMLTKTLLEDDKMAPMVKISCFQARRHKFNPQDPFGERRASGLHRRTMYGTCAPPHI